MNKKYKYEVAISFLEKDEELAYSINDEIKDSLTTFIYSKNQSVLVGADGEEIFNKVFGEEARIVVVLYRDGWGNTPWTRIEEIAIKRRAFDEGYDFTIYVPLDKPSKAPKYLPPTRIWHGIERFGIDSLPAIIEARVREVGGNIKEITAFDVAEKIKSENDFNSQKKSFLESKNGRDEAFKSIEVIWKEIEMHVKILNEKNIGFSFGFSVTPPNAINQSAEYIVYANEKSVRFNWFSPCGNTLSESRLLVAIYNGIYGDSYYSHFEKLIEKKGCKYLFDFDMSQSYFWSEPSNSNSSFTSKKLVDYWIKLFLESIVKKDNGGSFQYAII